MILINLTSIHIPRGLAIRDKDLPLHYTQLLLLLFLLYLHPYWCCIVLEVVSQCWSLSLAPGPGGLG